MFFGGGGLTKKERMHLIFGVKDQENSKMVGGEAGNMKYNPAFFSHHKGVMNFNCLPEYAPEWSEFVWPKFGLA